MEDVYLYANISVSSGLTHCGLWPLYDWVNQVIIGFDDVLVLVNGQFIM